MKKILLTFAALAAISLQACTNSETLKLYQVEPLYKVLHTDTLFVDQPDTLWAVKGESVCFQLVMTSLDSLDGLKATTGCRRGFKEIRTGWVHDVQNRNTSAWQPDAVWTPDNRYPDPIFDDFPESVSAGGHRTIWIDIDVPRDIRPGLKNVRIKVSGKNAEGKTVVAWKTLHIKVCNVTLPEQQGLKVVNWYEPDQLAKLSPEPEKIRIGNDAYLELLKNFAKTAAAYGQNCYLIREKPEIELNADSTGFVVDFTTFDKVMDVLIRYGNLQTFCSNHFGGRPAGAEWNESFRFGIYYVKDKKLHRDDVAYDDPRLEEYINKYYGIVENHFREKGWLDICYQHIADEPDLAGTDSQKSWSYVANLVKKAAPGLRTIDASSEIVENQDVSVVVLGDNIATMPAVPEGSERWMYTCCMPVGWFANRFVQQPLIKTRILHWLNFKYNEVGYLHWGYNIWGFSDDPLHDVTPRGEWWPGGDAWIVYPGKEKIYPSIRLCAMRNGIRDYDLLRMVEAKDPAKAQEFCNRIVQGPCQYDVDPANFRKVRREMLTFLTD